MREAGGASNDFLAQEGIQRGNPLLLASPTLYPQLKKMIHNNHYINLRVRLFLIMYSTQ